MLGDSASITNKWDIYCVEHIEKREIYAAQLQPADPIVSIHLADSRGFSADRLLKYLIYAAMKTWNLALNKFKKM